MQVALEKVGPRGLVVGVDLKPVDDLEHNGNSARIFLGDIMSSEIRDVLKAESPDGYDAVISDLSPKLSGIAFRDAAQSAQLVEMGLQIAREFLVEGGHFIAKIFPGQECEELIPQIRSSFKKCSRKNLDSTRKSSKELYILAEGFKGI
jgi:23S rRNA (uridine2552-2'-O)-methyltransferase